MLKTSLDTNFFTGWTLETTQDTNYSTEGMLATTQDTIITPSKDARNKSEH